jgi:hypothetical protein
MTRDFSGSEGRINNAKEVWRFAARWPKHDSERGVENLEAWAESELVSPMEKQVGTDGLLTNQGRA